MLASESPALPLEDLDLDHDLPELEGAVGKAALAAVTRELLERREVVCEPSLAPEIEGARAQRFLQLVALNLAFRLRTDELLAALCGWVANGPAPRLAARDLGRLLVRARSRRAALALLAASPLSEAERREAEAAVVPPALDLEGARLFLRCESQDAAASVLAAAVGGKHVPFATAPEEARRFVLLRRRGGWVTVLGENDAVEPELARSLASRAGVSRAAWMRSPGALLVFEGRRAVLELANAEEPDDVAGELRKLGVLDLDPDHPRGAAVLRFASAAEQLPRGARSIALVP